LPRAKKAAHGTPPRKARKPHLIKPTTALGQYEEPGESDPGNEAEYTEDERDRDVGIDAKHPTGNDDHSKQGCCPSEAHPDCPRMRRSHFRMIASAPGAARLLG